jgi:O-antigen ligase
MGTFIQPAVTGAAMVMIFFLAVYALARIKSIYARLYSWLLFIVTPVGVFFTYTRSVYLGFSLGLLLLTVFSRRLRLAAALLLIGMGLVVLGNWSNVKTAERESGGVADMTTAQGRVVLMNASLRMFMDHPFVGVGFQRFMEKSVPYIVQVKRTFLGYREGWIGLDSNQHNQFFSVLTELGLLGFIPFALMYVFLFRTLARARSAKVQEYDSEFVVAVWAAMAAYLSALMFIEPRYFEFLNTLPFMLMGIVVGGYERAMLMQRNAGRETAGLARKEYAA